MFNTRFRLRTTKEIMMSIAQAFARSGFARFVNSPAGRLVRIVAGIALIVLGYMRRDTSTGLLLIGLGLIPLAAGTFNLCIVSALLGGPISGARIAKGPPQP
jgi:hypothetical protein